jgi:hypothetical protein
MKGSYMTKDDFERYLKDRYYDQINWYDKKSVQAQKSFKILQWIIIVLSATTPVLIIILPDQYNLQIIPVVTSLAVTIAAAVLKSFSYQENWINYRTTCETLRKEIYYYEAGINDYTGNVDKEARFIERVESLISRENTVWLNVRHEATEKKEKDS